MTAKLTPFGRPSGPSGDRVSRAMIHYIDVGDSTASHGKRSKGGAIGVQTPYNTGCRIKSSIHELSDEQKALIGLPFVLWTLHFQSMEDLHEAVMEVSSHFVFGFMPGKDLSATTQGPAMTAIGGFKILQMLMQGVTDRDPPVLPVGWSMVPCGSFDGLELSTAVTKLWSKIKIACYTFEGVFISASTMFLALLAYSRMQAGDGAAVVCYGLPDLYTPPEVGEIYKKLKAVWHREPEAFGKVAAKDPSKGGTPSIKLLTEAEAATRFTFSRNSYASGGVLESGNATAQAGIAEEGRALVSAIGLHSFSQAEDALRAGLAPDIEIPCGSLYYVLGSIDVEKIRPVIEDIRRSLVKNDGNVMEHFGRLEDIALQMTIPEHDRIEVNCNLGPLIARFFEFAVSGLSTLNTLRQLTKCEGPLPKIFLSGGTFRPGGANNLLYLVFRELVKHLPGLLADYKRDVVQVAFKPNIVLGMALEDVPPGQKLKYQMEDFTGDGGVLTARGRSTPPSIEIWVLNRHDTWSRLIEGDDEGVEIVLQPMLDGYAPIALVMVALGNDHRSYQGEVVRNFDNYLEGAGDLSFTILFVESAAGVGTMTFQQRVVGLQELEFKVVAHAAAVGAPPPTYYLTTSQHTFDYMLYDSTVVMSKLGNLLRGRSGLALSKAIKSYLQRSKQMDPLVPLQDLVKVVLHVINEVAKTAQGCLLVGRSFGHYSDMEWVPGEQVPQKNVESVLADFDLPYVDKSEGDLVGRLVPGRHDIYEIMGDVVKKWAGLVDVGSEKMQEGQARRKRRRTLARGASVASDDVPMIEEEEGKLGWAEEMCFDFVE